VGAWNDGSRLDFFPCYQEGGSSRFKLPEMRLHGARDAFDFEPLAKATLDLARL
jgi:hypothetical protein